MKEIKLATLKIDLANGGEHREAICAWLHTKAEEIKEIESSKYVDKPSWNFII